MKKLTKIDFVVVYTPPMIVKISNFMASCDLGISEVQYPITEHWSWNTTSKTGRAYTIKMKNAIKGAVEAQGGKVISITKLKNEKTN